MDPLSDVLKSVRLEGAIYLNAEFTAPWCVQSRYGLASVRERLAGADHVMFFHFFTEGGCKVPLADGLVSGRTRRANRTRAGLDAWRTPQGVDGG